MAALYKLQRSSVCANRWSFCTACCCVLCRLQKSKWNASDKELACTVSQSSSQNFSFPTERQYDSPSWVHGTCAHNRESIEKFSQVAARSEVAENDYNLNIPRYVDTFDTEESIDLDAIAAKLTSLQQAIGENDAVIARFCNELNIEAPL